jgi:hypothetical protein
MSDDREIVQRRFGYTNRFHFGEDQLKFTARDSSGESTRSSHYETIDLDRSSTLKINAGKRYGLLVVLAGTAVTMAIQVTFPGRLDYATAAAGVSIAAYIALRYLNITTLTLTLLPLSNGAGKPIRITHGGRYDEIVQRIKSGRTAPAQASSRSKR